MTLCVTWKDKRGVHFASDSRLKFAASSYADVAIKVISLPYKIYSATDSETRLKTLDFEGDIGMCFAGSALNSLFIKETISEIIKNLQYAPPYTSVSMAKIAKIIFFAYKAISKAICATSLGEKGISDLFITGYCPENKCAETYRFQTDIHNKHTYKKVLSVEGDYLLSGSGATFAEKFLRENRLKTDSPSLLVALRETIQDLNQSDVGGNIQYGILEDQHFNVYGTSEYSALDGIKNWRGFLDLNDPEFMSSSDDFTMSYSFIMPFELTPTGL